MSPFLFFMGEYQLIYL